MHKSNVHIVVEAKLNLVSGSSQQVSDIEGGFGAQIRGK